VECYEQPFSLLYSYLCSLQAVVVDGIPSLDTNPNNYLRLLHEEQVVPVLPHIYLRKYCTDLKEFGIEGLHRKLILFISIG
jgi:hypothetical protein